MELRGNIFFFLQPKNSIEGRYKLPFPRSTVRLHFWRPTIKQKAAILTALLRYWTSFSSTGFRLIIIASTLEVHTQVNSEVEWFLHVHATVTGHLAFHVTHREGDLMQQFDQFQVYRRGGVPQPAPATWKYHELFLNTSLFSAVTFTSSLAETGILRKSATFREGQSNSCHAQRCAVIVLHK